jgi:translation initiation factor RLI1
LARRHQVFPGFGASEYVIPLLSLSGTNKRTDYFTKILEDDLKAIVKPQYVDRIPQAIKSADKTVRTLIEANSSMDNLTEVLDVLGRSQIPLASYVS